MEDLASNDHPPGAPDFSRIPRRTRRRFEWQILSSTPLAAGHVRETRAPGIRHAGLDQQPDDDWASGWDWDGDCIPQNPQYGLEYPAGSGIEHVYGAGPWIGGIVDGTRRVSEGYNGNSAQKFIRPDQRHPLRELIWQTSVRDSVDEPNRRGCDDDGDGTIDEDDLDGLDNDGDWVLANDDVGSDGIEDVNEVGCRGGYHATDNRDPNFDNYDRSKTDFCRPDANGNYRKQDDPDAYTEKNGLPDHGEPNVDEDYAAISDNDLYCSARDDNDPPSGHFPMGIKVIQKTFAWSGNFANAVIPFDYYFINTSSRSIEDVYVGWFGDLDVGPVSTAITTTVIIPVTSIRCGPPTSTTRSTAARPRSVSRCSGRRSRSTN